ncbi:MAG: hypothetical protein V2A76_10465 [Planctomycetota bacterium]
MKRSSVVIALLAGLSLSGCWSYPVAMTGATRPLTRGAYTELGPAQGSSTGYSVLHLITFGMDDPIGRARDAALGGTRADALINATVQMNHLFFLVLFGIHTTTISGTAVVEED